MHFSIVPVNGDKSLESFIHCAISILYAFGFIKTGLLQQVEARALFAGWTGAIQLAGIDKVLPPSFLLIESYGSPKTLVSDIQIPSGYTLKTTGDFLEAFVTFLHPTSKYSGPGTDGVISRDTVIEWHPQGSEKCNL